MDNHLVSFKERKEISPLEEIQEDGYMLVEGVLQ
jgi:hypothetical protein